MSIERFNWKKSAAVGVFLADENQDGGKCFIVKVRKFN